MIFHHAVQQCERGAAKDYVRCDDNERGQFEIRMRDRLNEYRIKHPQGVKSVRARDTVEVHPVPSTTFLAIFK
jgi:hypothetical protein